MKHIRLLTVEHPRDVKLLSNGVIGRRLKYRPEIRAELSADVEIAVLTQKNVFVLAIDTREMSQEVSRVGTDAEVV
jgi:hypothetical protein